MAARAGTYQVVMDTGLLYISISLKKTFLKEKGASWKTQFKKLLERLFVDYEGDRKWIARN